MLDNDPDSHRQVVYAIEAPALTPTSPLSVPVTGADGPRARHAQLAAEVADH